MFQHHPSWRSNTISSALFALCLFFGGQSASGQTYEVVTIPVLEDSKAYQLNNQGDVIAGSNTPIGLQNDRSNQAYTLSEASGGNMFYNSVFESNFYNDLFNDIPDGAAISFRGMSNVASDTLYIVGQVETQDDYNVNNGARDPEDDVPGVPSLDTIPQFASLFIEVTISGSSAATNATVTRTHIPSYDRLIGATQDAQHDVPTSHALRSVNDSGVAVGSADLSIPVHEYPFDDSGPGSLYPDFTFQTVLPVDGIIDALGGGADYLETSATAINESGQSTGRRSTGEPVPGESQIFEARAYIYDPNEAPVDRLTLLPNIGDATHPPTLVEGLDINDSGMVVGYAQGFDGDTRPYWFNGVDAIDLAGNSPTDQGVAHAINASGQIVGELNGEAVMFAAGGFTSLNTLLDTPLTDPLVRAIDINDDGLILAETSAGDYVTLLPPVELQPGGSPLTALLAPSNGSGGFDFTDGRSGDWYDPPVASGYEYTITDSASAFSEIIAFAPGFTGMSVTFFNPFDTNVDPFTLPDLIFGEGQVTSLNINDLLDNGYFDDLTAQEQSDLLATLIEFGSGEDAVSATYGIRVNGIDPAVDAQNPSAFPIQLGFAQPTASFTATPIGITDDGEPGFAFSQPTVIPEPASAMMLLAVAGLFVHHRRRRAGQCHS